MGVFGFLNKKEKTSIIFDINSGSIGGAIIKHYTDKNPEIIAVERINVNYLMDVDIDAFLRCARESFKKVSGKLAKKFSGKIDSALCVFSSPWQISKTGVIKVVEKHPVEITENFLEKLLEKEMGIFKDNLRGSRKLKIIERKITQFKLNGYLVKNPIGKIASSIEARAYVGAADKKLKESIDKNILENFGISDVSFHTFPFVAFNILKYTINAEEGMLFASVSGEITDVLLIRGNIPEKIASFSFGKNGLLRKISKSFGISINESQSIFEAWAKGHSNKKINKKMFEIMEDFKKEWHIFFKKVLEDMAESSQLPRNIFFVGGEFLTKELKKNAGKDLSSRLIVLSKPFKVGLFSFEAFKHHFDFAKNAGKTKDAFILIAALFADKFKV